MYDNESTEHVLSIKILWKQHVEKNGDHKNMNDYYKTGMITKKEKRVLNSTQLIPKRNTLFSPGSHSWFPVIIHIFLISNVFRAENFSYINRKPHLLGHLQSPGLVDQLASQI